ncbi:hypothetical protein WCQ02_06520 [Paraburkholderia tropica]
MYQVYNPERRMRLQHLSAPHLYNVRRSQTYLPWVADQHTFKPLSYNISKSAIANDEVRAFRRKERCVVVQRNPPPGWMTLEVALDLPVSASGQIASAIDHKDGRLAYDSRLDIRRENPT